MDFKEDVANDVSVKRKKDTISTEIKEQIIDKYEKGLRVVELAKLFNRSTSTICTILKKKEIKPIPEPYLLCDTMDLNKVVAKNRRKRKKDTINIEVKKEIIDKYEKGVRVVELAKLFNRTTSTICTILKKKEEIKGIPATDPFCDTAGPKKVVAKENRRKRKKDTITIEVKKEIIDKYEKGLRVVELARLYCRTTSTICTILKKKEEIKALTTAKGVTRLSKQRPPVIDELEKLLLVWINDKQLRGEAVTEAIICEEARHLYLDLLKESPGSSAEEMPEDTFKGSRGWFENFKKRSGIHIVVKGKTKHDGKTNAVTDHMGSSFHQGPSESSSSVAQSGFSLDIKTEEDEEIYPFVNEGLIPYDTEYLDNNCISFRREDPFRNIGPVKEDESIPNQQEGRAISVQSTAKHDGKTNRPTTEPSDGNFLQSLQESISSVVKSGDNIAVKTEKDEEIYPFVNEGLISYSRQYLDNNWSSIKQEDDLCSVKSEPIEGAEFISNEQEESTSAVQPMGSPFFQTESTSIFRSHEKSNKSQKFMSCADKTKVHPRDKAVRGVADEISGRRELSEAERGMIIGAHRFGHSVREISGKFQIPRATVSGVVVKWKREGVVKPQPRPGKLGRLSDRDRRTSSKIEFSS